MSELFSDEDLKALSQAQARGEEWDPELAGLAGRHIAELLREDERFAIPTPTLLVGVGELGVQLGKAALPHFRRDSIPPRVCLQADFDGPVSARVKGRGPKHGRTAVIVSADLPSADQLAILFYEIIRVDRTRVNGAVVVDGTWSDDQLATARCFGFAVHALVPHDDHGSQPYRSYRER